MDRRKALRSIGLSAGFMAVTPGMMSLLQSCKTDAATWVPVHLTPDQGALVRAITDVILPASDTPSATAVNVPEFIDKYIGSGISESDQQFFQWTLDELHKNLLESYGDISDIRHEEYVAFLSTHLRDAHKNAADLTARARSYAKAMEQGEKVDVDAGAINYAALSRLRDLAVFAYTNSEMVGKEVLAYDPIPGGYTGCGSLEELSGGKAWSL